MGWDVKRRLGSTVWLSRVQDGCMYQRMHHDKRIYANENPSPFLSLSLRRENVNERDEVRPDNLSSWRRASW